MSQSKLINNALKKLQHLEDLNKAVMQECYNTRMILERLSAPAPKGVARRALSIKTETELRSQLKKKFAAR